MATQHVKILVRRGLREQLSSDVLDTGEFGFTTDTNQLFIGIDPAINEVQFDPFINAHAIIQSWLDSDDCPFSGLTVDEDLVIRHIPTTYEADGTPISGVQALVDAMHFFTQEINLVGDYNVNVGDTVFQRKFTYADDEADIDNLVAEKTYQIREIKTNSDDFFNNASGTIGKTFSKYDNFTVRSDYGNGSGQVSNPHLHNGSRVVEIIDTTSYATGVVSFTEPYDSVNNSKNIIVRVREGSNQFMLDNPYVDNYYHFNGNGVDSSLDSDFGLFKYVSDEWVKQPVSIIDEANHPDGIETFLYNGVEFDKPSIELYNNTDINDHVVVTKSSKVTYWVRDEELADWKLLGSGRYEFGNIELNENTSVHVVPTNVVDKHDEKSGGYWKVIVTENANDNPTVTELVRNTDYILWLDDATLSAGEIRIPGIDSDAPEDVVEIKYYYNDDFQFSNNPPVSYTNQDNTYIPPVIRSNGDDLVEGDYYVYTDKDIFGGTNLNIFQWEPRDSNYQHNSVPVYYSDISASVNTSESVLIYAKPYAFEDSDDSVGVLELRQRDYNTSSMWSPYEYSDILSYYFSTNPIPSVSDPDLTYAYSISGRSEFSVGYLGRARRNVEVVTENSFNQLFADQHLSAQDSASGLRPSLFRKVFVEEDGVFLKFNKNINSVFFVDYSLKQIVGDRTFLRVGQLKIINGYPNNIPEIKLTDENTEIWHDNLSTGDADTIEDYDEFSNIVFETAVGEDQFGNETNDMLVIYRQDVGTTTEVSYTIKRWTM